MVLFQVPVLSLSLTGAAGGDPAPAAAAIVMLLSIGVFAPTMVGYDFRLDVDRIEALKTLPIAPSRLALGQVLAPAMVLTAGQWLTLAVIARLLRPDPALVAGAFALVPPGNLLLVELENLFFLWFPSRYVSGPSIDFQTMGRQMLLM